MRHIHTHSDYVARFYFSKSLSLQFICAQCVLLALGPRRAERYRRRYVRHICSERVAKNERSYGKKNNIGLCRMYHWNLSKGCTRYTYRLRSKATFLRAGTNTRSNTEPCKEYIGLTACYLKCGWRIALLTAQFESNKQLQRKHSAESPYNVCGSVCVCVCVRVQCARKWKITKKIE